MFKYHEGTIKYLHPTRRNSYMTIFASQSHGHHFGMRYVIGIVFLILYAFTALADDTKLRELSRADEALLWAAVGRVNVGEGSFCTGTLIEVNIVLTAAHCFFDGRTGERIADSEVRFVAGWNDGSAQSIRGAKKVVLDADYVYSTFVTDEMISNDVALIELDQPILASVIAPINIGSHPNVDAGVKIVSYGSGRQEVPSIQDACQVFKFARSVLTLSCDITFGSSGSPVIQIVNDQPQVVSVISAMRVTPGQKLAYSMALDQPLRALKQEVSVGLSERKTTTSDDAPLSEQLGRSGKKRESGLPQIGQ